MFQRDRFLFEADGWDLFAENAGKWKSKTKKFFNKALERHMRKGKVSRGVKGEAETALNEYIHALKLQAEKLGLKRTVRKWRESHFEWLVLFQIPPRTLKGEIARRAVADVKTISEGIESTAQLIGLTLQPAAAPGRPRGISGESNR